MEKYFLKKNRKKLLWLPHNMKLLRFDNLKCPSMFMVFASFWWFDFHSFFCSTASKTSSTNTKYLASAVKKCEWYSDKAEVLRRNRVSWIWICPVVRFQRTLSKPRAQWQKHLELVILTFISITIPLTFRPKHLQHCSKQLRITISAKAVVMVMEISLCFLLCRRHYPNRHSLNFFGYLGALVVLSPKSM